MAVARELKDVVEHLAAQGVLTASDTQVIFQALEQVQCDAPSPAPQTLSGPYYEARHKALHDRKVHP
jgi:hypothetical protein